MLSKEKELKNNLEQVVLDVLQLQPMCGYDLVKTIFQKYDVLVSPGTIYPLLYYLESGGVLKSELRKGKRSKIYFVKRK